MVFGAISFIVDCRSRPPLEQDQADIVSKEGYEMRQTRVSWADPYCLVLCAQGNYRL